ncbi:DeoR/GlpR transcriptional regulator [Nocardioides sp. HDW12B]|uniref:DeoR/GlpR family DNA-binding transcription regulator n=1 Tax=Nocardioides sp. HDW12B TaxID=2714939 RepID=UPI001407FE1D|nr:DeoR/GlpR family DNA-binding transcription regulator [Nocardioides sp. HDW12B]QIK67260.1 DeoR/GlpR transcriptional regulator [Nocardioides sp. HDW12B]
MQRSLRHSVIMRALTPSRLTSVEALVELTGVSAVTIRRDLVDLESHGLVQRRRGGALKAPQRGVRTHFTARYDTGRAAKEALAAHVATLIADDDSVILDNGTTCFAVAHELVGRPLTVLALSLRAAAVLASRPGPSVVVPGGPVETDSLALVGSAALEAVTEMRSDVLVLGACSASPAHGLTSTTYDDARIKRAALAAASRRVLVTTGEKLTSTSTFRFGVVGDVTDLVTTPDAPEEQRRRFADEGVTVHVVEPADA